ncbi:type I-C CRISPR-associated endonuclease Cas1c [Limisphaera sp. VF-2]|uniref:type I-C CRISPR-associated endonuclease Cas1c n=1 Tax=Limisphaera sp. VF-2 TaxID=3400418 RepID=UPI003C1EBC1D
MDVAQNTLYLTTPGSYVARDHLTLRVEVPVYPEDLPPEERVRERASDWRKVSIPIHHLESICVFGSSTISPPALQLCWEQGVAVNFLNDLGQLQARSVGVPDTSVTLRRTQFRAADDPGRCASIARQIIAGKIQNARNSLLRAARESDHPREQQRLGQTTEALAAHLRALGQWPQDQLCRPDALDRLRGVEGQAGALYFNDFSLMLKQQRDAFTFITRSRRPPRDRINCLLSFLYALVRHDCVAALTSVGLDPFVGFLHAERPNRPALALDLMEEFRPWLADRLALTLINRQQIGPEDFVQRDGGAVELTDAGRKRILKAYQERKQQRLTHPLLDQEFRIAQIPFVQARILARHLRGDLPDYVPFVPR